MKIVSRLLIICCFASMFPALLSAQNIYYRNEVRTTFGPVVPGAQVSVCLSTAPLTTIPCTQPNLVTIYTNAAGSVQAANPITADANGNYSFYAPAAAYVVTVTGNGLVPQAFYISLQGGGGIGSITWALPAFMGASPTTLSASGTQTFTFGQLPLAQLNGGSAPAGQSYDFTGVTLFKLRSAAGLTTSANGDFGYDTTNSNWHGWNGADSIYAPLASGFVSGDCGQPTSAAGKWTIVDVGFSCGGNPAGVNGSVQIKNGSALGAVTNFALDSPTAPTVFNVPFSLSTSGPNPRIDVQSPVYGGRPTNGQISTTCTTVGGNATINCASLANFKVGDGITIYKAGAAPTLATPAAPTVTSPFITGSATYSYECKAIDASGGLSAESALTSVTTAPNVFGNPPVAISGVTWAASVVTLTFSATFDANFASYTANTKTVSVTGMGTGLTALNGYWTIASEPSATSLTFALATSGSGTFTGATGRATNSVNGTTASRSGSTLTVNMAFALPIQVNGSTQPTVVILTGWLPADINGTYALASNIGDTVVGTAMTFHNTPLSETESSTQAGLITVYEANYITCPNVASPTIQYYVLGTSNPGGAMTVIGKTLYGQRTFMDYGYWLRTQASGFYIPPYVPSTPAGAAQNELYTGVIQSITGNSAVVSPAPASSVTSQTSLHDDSPAIQAAASALLGMSNGGDVDLSPPNSTSCSNCVYHVNAPLSLSSRVHLVLDAPLDANETITTNSYNGFEKGPHAVEQSPGGQFGHGQYEPIYGHANPILAMGGLQSTLEGVYFSSTNGAPSDDGQTLVQIGTLNQTGPFRIEKDYLYTGQAATSTPLVLNDGVAWTEIEDSVFNASWPHSISQPGQIYLLPPTLAAIWLRAGDNTTDDTAISGNVRTDGFVSFVGKGFLVDMTNAPTTGYALYNLQANNDDQQPVTCAFTDYGSASIAGGAYVSNVIMDSAPTPAICQLTSGLGQGNWTLTNILAQGGSNVVTGHVIPSLWAKDSDNPGVGPLGQNYDETDIAQAAINSTFPLSAKSVSAGTAPSSAGSTALGGIAFSEATSTGWTPTAGQDYMRADSTAHKFLFSLNGGAEGGLPLSSLGTQGADSVTMNATGSTAVPTAVTMPTCAASGHADVYDPSTHTWTCNALGGGAGPNFTVPITVAPSSGTTPTAINYSEATTGLGQQPLSAITTTAATTITVNAADNIGTGTSGVFFVLYASGSATITSTGPDSRGNTVTCSALVTPGVITGSLCYFNNSGTAGSWSDTITFSASVTAWVSGEIYTGFVTAAPLDGSIVTASGNSSAPNSGAYTSTNANDLIVTAIGTVFYTNRYALGGSFNERSYNMVNGISQDGGIIFGDQLASSTGSFTGSLALPAVLGGRWIAFTAGFKLTAAPQVATFGGNQSPQGYPWTGTDFWGITQVKKLATNEAYSLAGPGGLPGALNATSNQVGLCWLFTSTTSDCLDASDGQLNWGNNINIQPAQGIFKGASANLNVATGTAPLTITSTTPVANLTTVPTTYNAGGTQQTGAHIVEGSGTLAAGALVVTLTGAAAFTSASTYSCSATDSTATAAMSITYTSGTSVTFNGTTTDTFRYVCVGN